MERIVAKFGGSSVADAAQFRKVAAIMQADPRRRILVVSAPGKRRPDEAKITDLLYLCHDMAAMATSIDEPFGLITERFTGIAAELGLDSALPGLLQAFRSELEAGCSREFAVSRGEYFCARLMAEFLGRRVRGPGQPASSLRDGLVDPGELRAAARPPCRPGRMYVMAGFYGRNHPGRDHHLLRGGSDISGAIAARAAGAVPELDRHLELPHRRPAHRRRRRPRAIEESPSARCVRWPTWSRRVPRRAILPVREAGIGGHPQHQPARRCGHAHRAQARCRSAHLHRDRRHQRPEQRPLITVEKSLMNKEIGFGHRLLGIFLQHRLRALPVEHRLDGDVIDLDNKLRGLDQTVLDDIEGASSSRTASRSRRTWRSSPWSARAWCTPWALPPRSSPRWRGAHQRARDQPGRLEEINIIVGVAAGDYEEAVRAIYRAFVPEESPTAC